jgi:hypothetical protein
MTGPDISKGRSTDHDAEYDAEGNGGVTTATHSSAYSAASAFSDDSSESPYRSSASGPTTGATSTWTGSPYEPLPSDSASGDYSSSGLTAFSDSDSGYAVPSLEAVRPTPPPPVAGKQTKSRAVAALVSAVLGTLLVGGGLYLIGEFGFRIYDVMLNVGGQPSPWDIAWTSTGAGLIFIAVLLNGWSPWATLLPGLALTGAGIWSIAWYDGADRVATFVDQMFARPEMVLWGVTGWMLVIGLVLVGASGAAIIARAAGRRRGRP